MNNDVTAVILTANPSFRPMCNLHGARPLIHHSRFSDPQGLLEARLAAIQKVQTPWFFFMDDGDLLPVSPRVALDEASATGAAVVFTDEVQGKALVRGQPYTRQAHAENPLLIHRLALCRTEVAQRVAGLVPIGQLAFEPVFYWLLAKHGAAYVPQACYWWVTSKRGFSRSEQYLKALTQAFLWVQAEAQTEFAE